jgi:RNA polymerase sigma-70 factor (ECF subfamily)
MTFSEVDPEFAPPINESEKLSPAEREDRIARAQTGDFEALIPVLQQFEYIVRGHIIRLDDVEDQKDCRSEVMTKVLTDIGRYNLGTNFRMWLGTVAKNTVIDTYDKSTSPDRAGPSERTKKYQPTDPFEIRGILSGIPEDSTYGDPELTYEYAAAVERAERAANLLTLDQRNAIRKRRFEGLSNQEASDELGISVNAVKVRLHRAERRLKSLYDDGLLDIDLDSRTINT